jgi:hypothetical protein
VLGSWSRYGRRRIARTQGPMAFRGRDRVPLFRVEQDRSR